MIDDKRDLGPPTDDQESRARSPAIQIFNNAYAKLVKNRKVLCWKLQSQALVYRYYELNAITQAVMQTPKWNTTNDTYNESIAGMLSLSGIAISLI